MQSVVEVLEPAQDISLITLYEAKLGMNMATVVNPVLDDQIEMMVRWASDEIATMCNRIFARETVRETVSDFDQMFSRLYLSHFPVGDITSVNEDGTDLVVGDDYTLDTRAGVLIRTDSVWSPTTTITYTGGYELPFGAPPALQHAAVLLTREAYNAALRGDATVRMVAHKEARIIYFDPNAIAKGIGQQSGSPAKRAVSDLLSKYTRYWI